MRLIPAILLCTTLALQVARAQNNAGQQDKQVTAKASTPHATKAASSAATRNTGAADEQQALRDDLKKMRVILQQMQTNLAFVDNSPSPLKHQFQLEIDMWRELINQMERRVQSSER